jgi:hypothetical protein
MASLVPEGTNVEFRPDASWRWVAFDGCLATRASLRRINLEDNWALVDVDLLQLAPQLIGKQYAAVGFDDIPGTLVQVSLTIDEATLFGRAVLEGRKTATTETRGTFSICVAPSLKAGAPPIPDPQTMHRGTWRFRPLPRRRTQC